MTNDELLAKAVEGLVEAPGWELKVKLIEARAAIEGAKTTLEVTVARYPLPQLKAAHDQMHKLMADAIDLLDYAQAQVDPMQKTQLQEDLEQQVRDGLITQKEADKILSK
jgi:hypothetical protein